MTLSERTRDYPLQLGAHPKASQSILIRGDHILGPLRVLQPSMLWPHARVSKSRGDSVHVCDLAGRRLENICPSAMEHSWMACAEGCAMTMGFNPCEYIESKKRSAKGCIQK
jgi:hypothetical protein